MPIIGHERQIRLLDTHIKRDRISHAYVFSGTSHIGKRAVAHSFVQSLLCANRPADVLGSCGACRSCVSILANNHPDVHIISSDYKDNLKPHIGVRDIYSIRERIGQAAFFDSYKVIIIDDASYLGWEASPALLKILEEPIGKTLFLLLATNKNSLLPTIMSRVWHMAFWPVSCQRLEVYGREICRWNEEKARMVGFIAEGRPGIFLRLGGLKISEITKEYEQIIHERDQMRYASLADQFSFIENRLAHDRTDDAWYAGSIGGLMRVLEDSLGGKTKNKLNSQIVSAPRVAYWIRNSLEEQSDVRLPFMQKKIRMEIGALNRYTV
jgi:DNA polymerase III delta prime subunit